MGMTVPTFYDPDRVGELYLDRAALVADEAKSYGEKNDIRPAAQDEFKIAAFGRKSHAKWCIVACRDRLENIGIRGELEVQASFGFLDLVRVWIADTIVSDGSNGEDNGHWDRQHDYSQ